MFGSVAMTIREHEPADSTDEGEAMVLDELGGR
jgi:hypothetical protein